MKIINSDTKFVVYTNYKKDLTDNFIKKIKDDNRFELYYNTGFMYSKGLPLVEKIDSKEYFKIEKKLKEISAKNDNPPDTWDYYYIPKNFINLLEEYMQTDLQNIKSRNKKRLKILGEDRLLYSAAVDQIVAPHRPLWYDLKNGVPRIFNENESLVLLNFDTLGDDGFNKLDKEVRKVSKDVFVILQTFRKRFIQSFDKYYEIELPDKKKINNMISNIFASFILEIDPYRKDYYKLKPLIQSNALNELLSEMSDLTTLQKVMNKFEVFHFDNILSNTDMWYFFIKELKPREDMNIAPKEKVKIEFEWRDDKWNIYGLPGGPISNNLIGTSFLAIIFAYCNQYQKPIDVSLLRDIEIDLFDKPKKNYSQKKDYGNDRKAIFKNLDKIKGNDRLNDFCENCIIYSKRKYYVKSSNEIEYQIDIIHPKLTPDYFSRYHK